ncbi:SH3 domain-containing protein [Rheinheimera nanhaiensis]|uniref:SH3 domain-containing protein n=1 Tax=Rheinheimera nanhaiensis TaxID=1163621 RepID=UPI0011D27F69|nr:SH3 domain-containing protein [Rheinheimera nanhaiensis]
MPFVQPEQLQLQFWQQRLSQGDRLLLTTAQIAERNRQTFALQKELQPLSALPGQYSADELTAIIDNVSKIPSSPRFYTNGTALSAADWQRYQVLLGKDRVKETNPVAFALIVKRTALRAFPTLDRVVNEQGNADLDRFAETALFVAEPVAVLHQSRDKAWLLVQSFNYTGWVQAADVAIGSREQVLSYAEQEPFLVITAAKAHTAYTPAQPALSELQLDMGVRLPLISAADTGFNVHGQNPLASYIVQLPQRLNDGRLHFLPALLPLSSDVSIGYLPFTERNLLSQAFKFLGERYGWGHDYNGRDCTGFISEVFRSFGLLMPRNSSQQGMGNYGTNLRFNQHSSQAEKLQALAQARVGDLLYFPGHVSMFIGRVQQQPFMIHSVNTLIYPTDAGLYQGTLNGVVVTPLMPLHNNTEHAYLEALYAIKSLR